MTEIRTEKRWTTLLPLVALVVAGGILMNGHTEPNERVKSKSIDQIAVPESGASTVAGTTASPASETPVLSRDEAVAAALKFYSTGEEEKRANLPSKSIFGISERIPLTTSHVTGSPEPPPPYRTERAFPQLSFVNPTFMAFAPNSDRIYIGEQRGQIHTFPNDPASAKAELLIDLKKDLTSIDPKGPHASMGELYGFAFHPQFETNRYCYICYTLNPKDGSQQPDGSRVSRFVITETDPPRCDPASEQIVITWLGQGHNGGCLEFGPEGFLYISTGDGSFPNPPDALLAGQDVSNLLSSVLRIDVDHPDTEKGMNYSIPKDNPFVDLPDARGEIWAYGFRNPWKITFDRETGDLWLGDAGWEQYEMVHFIVKGGNYGWSVMEGSQTVRVEAKRGPTPILPPAIELPHSKAASVSGGYIYRGKKFPELQGAYIFGDWETRRMWAARWDGEKVTSYPEIVDPELRVVAYGQDHDGELYVLDYDLGTIYQFEKNEIPTTQTPFPTKLSETGLFASVADHQPVPGVIPFSINAEQWADYAAAERWLALPQSTGIRVHPDSVPVTGTIMTTKFEFPKDTVLVKTLSLEMETGKPETSRNIETQLLHYTGKIWSGYSYRWNDEGTDAELVPIEGAETMLTIADASAPGGVREQSYVFPGRAACARCHNPWTQNTLAFQIPQINRVHHYGEVSDQQLRTLTHVGALVWIDHLGQEVPAQQAVEVNQPWLTLPQLPDPFAESETDLYHRGRAYLQANCAHCHQMGGGGAADIDLRYDIPMEKTKTAGIRPLQGPFGISEAMIIAPGDPYRSVLFYRISKLGRGRMPHLGSEIPDPHGVALMQDWIRQLPARTSDMFLIEKLESLDELQTLAREANRQNLEIERIAKYLASREERKEVTAADREAAKIQAKSEAEARVAARAKERQETIEKLLENTPRAVLLSRAIMEQRLTPSIIEQVVAKAATHTDPQIRELFEIYLPASQRMKRLGSVVRPAELLALEGDPERGKELFTTAAGIQCKNCHKIGMVGKEVGPELSQIGKKYDRAKLLESILEPSKLIEQKFITWLVETTQGTIHTGLLIRQSDAEIVLRDAQDKELVFARADVEQFLPQRQSLMPELLLRDMSKEQVADLLAYLETLK
ncbi:MAG: PQQ-dependent sugar dehydrogenase [Planctomycetaceae bacterium]